MGSLTRREISREKSHASIQAWQLPNCCQTNVRETAEYWVGNMRQDEVLAQEASVILRKMPTGYTFLIEVADELLGGRELLQSLQLHLQIGNLCIPNLEECNHVLILDITG